jgi:ABC-type nitrate/sulfonate/bicarbonate transport system permease component
MIGHRMAQSRNSFWLGVLAILGAVCLWQGISSLPSASPRIIPSPLQVTSAFVEMLMDGRLLADAGVSIGRVLIGFTLGSIAAILCGVVTGRNQTARKLLGPIINLLRPIPAISIVPLAIIWFGLGETSKVFTVFWGVFFPVWVSTHVGVSSVNIEYLWVAQSLGVTRWAILGEVVLPGAATVILAGMRTGVSIGFICLVAAEMAGASSGLGFRISISHLTFRVDQMIAAIAMLGILGAVADKLFVSAAHKLFPWYARSQRVYQGD